MKKFKSILLFGTMVLAAIACTREAALETAPEPEGELVSVSFPVTLQEEGITKANTSDSADKLLWVFVFDGDGKHILGMDQKLPMENGQANVQARLLGGKTYTFAFWAASAAYDADNVFTNSMDEVTVGLGELYRTYGPGSPQIEAFYGKVTLTAGTDKLSGVSLKRPFAQVNVGIPYADSLYAANQLGVLFKEVETRMDVSLPTQFSLSGGTISFNESFSTNYTACPRDRFIDVRNAAGKPVEAECYTRVASVYALADDVHTELKSDCKIYLKGRQDGANFEFFKDLKANNTSIPIKPNQQTNILGNLFQGTLEPLYLMSFDYDTSLDVYVHTSNNQLWFREGDTVSINIDITTAGISIQDVYYETRAYYYQEHLQVTSSAYSYHVQFIMPASEVKVYIIFQ